MLPAFAEDGNLPPGIHWATWPELVEHGFNDHRRTLLAGLREALLALQAAGCRIAWLDGSFVTAKETPGDFDACWELDGTDIERVPRVFFMLDYRRAGLKARFKGELFPVRCVGTPGIPRVMQLFQTDRQTGRAKGMVSLDLQGIAL